MQANSPSPRKKSRLTLFLSVVMLPLMILLVVGTFIWQHDKAEAAPQLDVRIVAGYNVIVDSNVTSPSTYAPSVATVMGYFCNTSTAGETLDNVIAYIGDGTTPGTYPSRTVDAAFIAEHPALTNPGSYAFTHGGGSLGTARRGQQARCRYKPAGKPSWAGL